MSDYEFKAWMREVDSYLFATCGVVSSDLPDMTWRDWFDDGYDPDEAAREALVECE